MRLSFCTSHKPVAIIRSQGSLAIVLNIILPYMRIPGQAGHITQSGSVASGGTQIADKKVVHAKAERSSPSTVRVRAGPTPDRPQLRDRVRHGCLREERLHSWTQHPLRRVRPMPGHGNSIEQIVAERKIQMSNLNCQGARAGSWLALLFCFLVLFLILPTTESPGNRIAALG